MFIDPSTKCIYMYITRLLIYHRQPTITYFISLLIIFLLRVIIIVFPGGIFDLSAVYISTTFY